MLEDSKWDDVEAVANELIDKVKAESPKDDTEFKTIWKVAYKEGFVAGIQTLISKLNQYAQKS